MSDIKSSNHISSGTAKDLSDELLQFCESDALSEEGLRKIIAKYGFTPNNNLHDVYDFDLYDFFFEACSNEFITEDIIVLLIKNFPCGPCKFDFDDGTTALHHACQNKNMTANIIQKLIEAAPDFFPYFADDDGDLPIHNLCCNEDIDEKVALNILKLLLDEFPETARTANKEGELPLHIAAEKGTPDFCQLLIESYPGSVRVSTKCEELPLHYACHDNSLPTVEYLYNLYPDAVNHATTEGKYPIHYAIKNGMGRRRATLKIVQYLLDCDPRVKSQKIGTDFLLHFACMQTNDDSNVEACFQMIEAIYDAYPISVYCPSVGGLPIHNLCRWKNRKIEDEKVGRKILKLLLDKHPESIRGTMNSERNLPLHCASSKRSPEYCQLLIESYPGSVRVRNSDGVLPLHYACHDNTLPAVRYLYILYPDAVNHATLSGLYPIHCTVMRPSQKRKAALDIVQFLLDCDPRVKVQKFRGKSLLHFACRQEYKDSTIKVGIQIITAIYDAYPGAILDNNTFTSNIHRWHEQVQAFINNEMIYVRQARSFRQMTTPDEQGQLPLHRALRNNASLGSIKLILKVNPSTVRNVDNNCSLPLHLACQHHDSPLVIEHLIDLYPSSIRHIDFDHNTVLHYACRGLNYGSIALLLDKYEAASVSKRNIHNQLPIDMLFESIAVEDRESIEYTDCVYRLFRAYPVTMTMKMGTMQMG